MELPSDVPRHYADGVERGRLDSGMGRLEEMRTWDLLARCLPPAPAVVLDVGGGPGRHAVELAAQAYDVHLIDPVPLHVEQALLAASMSTRALASVSLADACADAVLLMEPLFPRIVFDDLQVGIHRNPTDEPGWCTTAYFLLGMSSHLLASGRRV